jgi:hypothetical protein
MTFKLPTWPVVMACRGAPGAPSALGLTVLTGLAGAGADAAMGIVALGNSGAAGLLAQAVNSSKPDTAGIKTSREKRCFGRREDVI